MIRNERQFRVTTAQRARLAKDLTKPGSEGVPDWVAQASRAAIVAQIMEMDHEIAEYLDIREGTLPSAAEVADLADLPRSPTVVRIAAQLTQRDLADRLGLREQQIQRYEATDYAGASLGRLEEVMHALGLTFRGEVDLPPTSGDGAALRRGLGRTGP